jgi:S-adenosylmethionine:tRNA ribosyltransferase-isomerase
LFCATGFDASVECNSYNRSEYRNSPDKSSMNLSDFDFDLPQALIAQSPAEPRDSSRLMVLDRPTESITHRHFRDIIDLINPGDVLVMNTTRVIPARIPGFRADTGGTLEILLLRQLDDVRWQVLVGGKRADIGMPIGFHLEGVTAAVVDILDGSERVIAFNRPVNDLLQQLGQIPLPPYIHSYHGDSERYQTIYSHHEGSAAAPTAGLHFTPELLIALRNKDVHLAYCTLHIGLDTFQPVRVEQVEQHKIHTERALLSDTDAQLINRAKLEGGRVIAVGTTSARTLETAAILSAGGDPVRPLATGDACAWRPVMAFEEDTSLFIYPGYNWRVVDALITNFHLPRSTLLMMIASFAGLEFVMGAYEVAKQEAYRFFSFGDAMFIS